MNSTIIVNTESDSPQSVAPETPLPGLADPPSPVERWLANHLDMIELTIVAAGFALRLQTAARGYFNPDELLHYLMINQASAWLAYKASLTNAHPPLIYALLYIAHFVNHSEFVLRLPSVFAGTALCWFLYKWIGTVLGKAAGLIGLVLVTFSPAITALSAEVREYALLLFCMAASMYFLEQALQEKSVAKMWGFSAFLYLAILTHYSATFFALALGVYVLARIGDSGVPRNVIVAWACGQAGALAIYAFLYVTHVSKLKNAISAWGTPYEQAYFRLDRESIFTFTQKKTLGIFVYQYAERHIALAMLLFFVLGVAALFVRDMVSRSGNSSPRHLGILLLLPFVALWGAAIAGIYPYIGSRHTIFLAPFAIAAASSFLATVTGRKLWAGLLVAALLMGLSNAYGKSLEPGIPKEDLSRGLMTSAMNYLQTSVARGDFIVTDYESNVTLEYYLCGRIGPLPPDAYRGDINHEYNCGGYSIVPVQVWKLRPQILELEFTKMARLYGLKPGGRVWVFQAGWGDSLDKTLPVDAPALRCIRPVKFGENLTIVPLVAGADSLPASPLPSC